jgi:hypothetical protein
LHGIRIRLLYSIQADHKNGYLPIRSAIFENNISYG